MCIYCMFFFKDTKLSLCTRWINIQFNSNPLANPGHTIEIRVLKKKKKKDDKKQFFDVTRSAEHLDKNTSASLAKTAGEGESSAHNCVVGVWVCALHSVCHFLSFSMSVCLWVQLFKCMCVWASAYLKR